MIYYIIYFRVKFINVCLFKEHKLKFSGAYSCGDTPVPIPNTEVKSATLIVLAWRRAGRVGSARIKF